VIQPNVRGGTGAEKRFLRDSHRVKPRTGFAASWARDSAAGDGELRPQQPGVIREKWDKLQAGAAQAERDLWSLFSRRPFVESGKERFTYKVRGGELTVRDKEGKVVMSEKSERFKQYEGVTLDGVSEGKGPTQVTGGWWSRAKLQRNEKSWAGVREYLDNEKQGMKQVTGYTRGLVAGKIKDQAKRGVQKSASRAYSGVKQGARLVFRRNR